MPNAGVIAVGDVNGDGHPDLVNPDVHIAKGNGKGEFGTPKYYPVDSSPYYDGWAYYVILADTRNLGKLDIITQDALEGVSVLLKYGKGTYRDGVVTVTSEVLGCGVSADFNSNGEPDLALSNGSGITMLFGTGSATKPFDAGPTTTVASANCAVQGDLNGDGIPDLLIPVIAAAPATTTTWYSYLRNGDGTFAQAGKSVNPGYGWMVLADFNQDGKLDYANASNVLALGNGNGTFRTPQPFATIQAPTLFFNAIAVGDLNGDGYPDLILTDGQHQMLYVLLNNKLGGWTQTVLHVPGEYPQCGFPQAQLITDVTGNGLADALLSCTGAGGAGMFVNKGGEELAYLNDVCTYEGSEVGWATVADVNGDGIPDIEALSFNTLSICTGTGGGQFSQPTFWGVGQHPGEQIPMDLHGQSAKSGRSDFAVPDETGRILSIINTTKRFESVSPS